MKRATPWLTISMGLSFVLLAAGCSRKESPLGSKENPIKMYFTPSQDADRIFTTSKDMGNFLTQETGYHFKTAVPTSYIAVVESFGTGQAEVAFLNTFGYVLANQKYGVEARIRVLRRGIDYYQGQIIARTDSTIKKLEDLAGKRFAFTDPSSTSGYLYPTKMFKDKGIHLGPTTFGGKHDSVVIMVYQGKVDAGATFYSAPADGEIKDARRLVKTQYPDVEEKIAIIDLTEKIPNDPVAFRKDLPDEMKNKIVAALMKFAQTEAGKKTLTDLYDISGLVEVKDADYDSIRKTLMALGADVASLVK